MVFTDPQNEVLSDTGLAWPLVGESLAENNTIEHMDRLFAAGFFQRRGMLNLDGLAGSGADWLSRFKPGFQERLPDNVR